MSENFQLLVLVWMFLGLFLFPVQLFITAPYGRHVRKNWGPMMSNKWGWIIMEAVSIIVLLTFFLSGDIVKGVGNFIFMGFWLLHYIHRTFIFPFMTRTSGKKMPVLIVLMAAFFNLVNASTNGYYLGSIQTYTLDWLSDPRFIIGIILFLAGMSINMVSDYTLIGLRTSGGQGYKIPKGGLFKYVSCPNHLGEIIEWTGFAVMCWNLPALAFAVWTASNLIPRAISHHRWYRAHFSDYPSGRKAIIPGVF